MINIPDLASIYHVPLQMVDQNIVPILTERLQLVIPVRIKPRRFMSRWRELADRSENMRRTVKIALVGKYTQLEDAYASVIKALGHAALAVNHKLVLTHIASTDLEEEQKRRVSQKKLTYTY